jgi:D-alanyl-D-alanine carboxypeptidase (penicillin-binding protein 5/6)
MRLISVVMGTSSMRARASQTRSLLNYGFRFFETGTLFEAGQELDTPRVWKGQLDNVSVGILEQAIVTLPRGKMKNVSTDVQLQQDIIAPLAVGDKVGEVVVSLDGGTVFRSPVVALQTVEPGGFFARLWDTLLMWIFSLFRT